MNSPQYSHTTCDENVIMFSSKNQIHEITVLNIIRIDEILRNRNENPTEANH